MSTYNELIGVRDS